MHCPVDDEGNVCRFASGSESGEELLDPLAICSYSALNVGMYLLALVLDRVCNHTGCFIYRNKVQWICAQLVQKTHHAYNCRSNHGQCVGSAYLCICDPGYTGRDCGSRECPFGTDWSEQQRHLPLATTFVLLYSIIVTNTCTNSVWMCLSNTHLQVRRDQHCRPAYRRCDVL